MSICLVDTSTSRDIYINDALVNQGLALLDEDTELDESGLEPFLLEGELPDVRSIVCREGSFQLVVTSLGRWEVSP